MVPATGGAATAPTTRMNQNHACAAMPPARYERTTLRSKRAITTLFLFRTRRPTIPGIERRKLLHAEEEENGLVEMSADFLRNSSHHIND